MMRVCATANATVLRHDVTNGDLLIGRFRGGDAALDAVSYQRPRGKSVRAAEASPR